MRRWRSAIRGATLLTLVVAGCAGAPASTPTPTATPTPSPAPSPAAETCDARRIRAQIQQMLAGRIFETHFLTINGELTISVWLVDPKIEAAAQEGLTAGNRQALETGLTLSHAIVDEIPCAARVFENVNPMIVDSGYVSWYVDIIPTRTFVDLKDPTLPDLIDAVARSGSGPASGRRSMPRAQVPTPSGSCTWSQARAALETRLGAERDNSAAYLIVGGAIVAGSRWGDSRADVAVQVQVEIHRPSDTDDAVLLARLGGLARELACVQPAIDQLDLFVVSPGGRLAVYARVPGKLIRPDAGPLPATQVLLYHYPAAGRP